MTGTARGKEEEEEVSTCYSIRRVLHQLLKTFKLAVLNTGAIGSCLFFVKLKTEIPEPSIRRL